MFDYDFMVNAFAAATIVAIAAGLVGYFLVLRGQTFAGHALSHVGFAGATGVGRIATPGAAGGATAGVAVAGRTAAAASPGVKIRRFTFSTTTALLRPCEKLCLTVPCSTGRFRCNVAFGGATPTVLSLLPVSLMPIPNRLASQPN